MLSRIVCSRGLAASASRSGAGLVATRGMARMSLRNANAAAPGAAARSGVSSSRLVVGGLAAAGVVGLGVFGGTIFQSINSSAGTVNDNAVWPSYVKQRVQQTFIALGAGTVMTGIAMVGLWRAGAAFVLAERPFLSMFGGLAALVGCQMLVHAVPYENTIAKFGSLALFNTVVGFTICPLVAFGGPLLLRAAAYSGAIVGSLCFVAANSPSDKFLWMAGPLAMGLGVVFISSIGAAFLPMTSRAFSMLHSVSLYGGLALFSGFVLFDTSRILEAAKFSSTFDPVSASIRIYMDAVNIFIRLVQIMGGSNRK